MKKRAPCEGRVYLRRSDTRQELSFATQLEWALDRARSLNVVLEGTIADVEEMVAKNETHRGHIYLDNGVSGAVTNRPGFAALRKAVKAEHKVSHLFAYRRDRLGRPENAVEMMSIEQELVRPGVTLVFTDGIVEPSPRGKPDLGHLVQMLFGYQESGAYLSALAERIIRAQKALAQEGFRTGGNAPYGFGRFLTNAKGEVLTELPPGRRVKQAGCHVKIMPVDQNKIAIWVYILDLKHQGWGCKKIARHLNDMKIPSPDAGKTRTDHGVKHLVSGKWSPNTVADLCRNPAIIGIQEFGQRSEGAHRRLGADGPRLLEDADRLTNEQTRVVFNDKSVRVSAELGIEPKYSTEKWKEIQEETTSRGSSQRGVPRSKDPSKYPLACRVHDLSTGCGSVMYGVTVGNRRLYRCSRYTNTGGAECHQNSVDAEALLAFAMASIARRVSPDDKQQELRDLVAKQIAATAATADSKALDVLARQKSRLTSLRDDLVTNERRLGTEKDDALYQALAKQYRERQQEIKQVEAEVERLSEQVATESNTGPEGEIEAAMGLLEQWSELLANPEARQELTNLFKQLGLRIGAHFREGIFGKSRRVRRFASGIMVFGDATLPAPQNLGHEQTALEQPNTPALSAEIGDTKEKLLPPSGDGKQLSVDDALSCPQESNSLGKVSRGDRI